MQLSVLVTIVLGAATCISPPIVAIINNWHIRKLKVIELSSGETLKKMELNAEVKQRILISEYESKYNSYQKFILSASEYIFDYKNPQKYSELLAAYSLCIMNGLTWADMDGFMQYVKPPSSISELNENSLEQMSSFLSDDISSKFNKSLLETLEKNIIS